MRHSWMSGAVSFLRGAVAPGERWPVSSETDDSVGSEAEP